MDRTYLVEVTAGPHTWTVTDTDPPAYGLADPLTIGWTLPDPDHRPHQPDPLIASFSVVAPTSAAVDLGVGDPVTIKVTFGPNDKPAPDVVFLGRVAQGEAAADPAGMLYRFTCADHSVDLTGYDIGADPYPVQSVTARQAQLLANAHVADLQVVRDPVVAAADVNLMVEKIDQPGAAPLFTAMVDLWDQVGLPGAGALAPVNYRAIVAPFPPDTKGAQRWALDVVPDAYVPSTDAPLPATFGPFFPPPQKYGVYVDPDDRHAGVIDACHVELDSKWAALQRSVANRAAVTRLYTSSFGLDPDGKPFDRGQIADYYLESPIPADQVPVTTTRETTTISLLTLTDPTVVAVLANTKRLGAMMIPAPQNPAGWAPDGFQWLLYKDQIGLDDFPVVFPHHDADMTPGVRHRRTACYVRPIVVTGIPGKWNAADPGRDYIAGQLSAVKLTISDGRPVVDFELTPTVPDPAPETAPESGGMTWNDKGLTGPPPALPAQWNTLYPQSWNAYRLARATPR